MQFTTTLAKNVANRDPNADNGFTGEEGQEDQPLAGIPDFDCLREDEKMPEADTVDYEMFEKNFNTTNNVPF